jgi:hypothetical protein
MKNELNKIEVLMTVTEQVCYITGLKPAQRFGRWHTVEIISYIYSKMAHS